jgi:predicted NUDIX family NTP pyrophosphohydrolase
MPKHSAGILLFRRTHAGIEVLLVHPGGPFWKNKDDGAWSIPKGEFDPSEDAEEAARREFEEELGLGVPDVPLRQLHMVRYTSGKYVHCWTGEADLDVRRIESNMFEMEWPPRSGQRQSFPEVDRAEWFDLEIAGLKINKGQRPLLDQLIRSIAAGQ